MKTEVLRIPEIGEEYERFTHRSGLTVILSKKDFSTAYGSLCVDFGSLLEDCVDENGERFVCPDGTAHFLEHKMFDNPDGVDTFVKFAALGADANAYTSYDRTCYLFSTAENLHESLDVLLSCVFTPWFTKASVRKEKGIIIQELKMYRDNPYEAVSRKLYAAMYDSSRIRNDIVGSIGSVKSVTPEILYGVYKRFYRPERMILTLCGHFDADKVIEMLDRYIPDERRDLPRVFSAREKEPARVVKRALRTVCDFPTPLVVIGVKCDFVFEKVDRTDAFNYMSAIEHALFSTTSPFIRELRRRDLLPQDSSADVVCDRDFAHILFFAHTYDSEELKKIFFDCFDRLKREKIGKETLEQTKKLLYSSTLCDFNGAESIAQTLTSDAFEGVNTTAVPARILEMTKEEADRFLDALLRPEAMTVLTALPRRQKKGEPKSERDH